MSYDQFYYYQYLDHLFFKVNYNQHYKFHLKLLHFLQFTFIFEFLKLFSYLIKHCILFISYLWVIIFEFYKSNRMWYF